MNIYIYDSYLETLKQSHLKFFKTNKKSIYNSKMLNTLVNKKIMVIFFKQNLSPFSLYFEKLTRHCLTSFNIKKKFIATLINFCNFLFTVKSISLNRIFLRSKLKVRTYLKKRVLKQILLFLF